MEHCHQAAVNVFNVAPAVLPPLEVRDRVVVLAGAGPEFVLFDVVRVEPVTGLDLAQHDVPLADLVIGLDGRERGPPGGGSAHTLRARMGGGGRRRTANGE